MENLIASNPLVLAAVAAVAILVCRFVNKLVQEGAALPLLAAIGVMGVIAFFAVRFAQGV